MKLEKTKQEWIQPQERKWLEKFFTDIMLRENGIYTLWGSKPMTLIVLDHTPKEKVQAWMDEMSAEERKGLISLQEPYDLPENWEKWEGIRSRFSLSNYLFFKRAREDQSPIEDIYFINIRQTAFAIEENYDLFKKHMESDFDPLKATFEIGDPKSIFWQKTVHNPTLLGILFGYGKKNAQCFNWKYWSSSEDDQSMESFLDSLCFTHSNHPRDFQTISINKFSLPYFASFFPPGEDDVIKKYENERKRIQKIYKKKDFLLETLRKLTSIPK